MNKEKFNVWKCINCNSSIVVKVNLNMFTVEIEYELECCGSPKIVSPNINKTDVIRLESKGDGYAVRKHCKALTYKPKIQAFLEGKVKGTIRPYHTVEKGDSILFHGWKGRPYHSSWTWRMRVTVSKVENFQMFKDGIAQNGIFFQWRFLDIMARNDGIAKIDGLGYGESMGVLFNEKYGKDMFTSKDWKNKARNGKKMQNIRWDEFEIITLGDETNAK
ncbi:hypothetical protein KAU43_03760 [candidate division WOR-3 bacterium]|nr:hypothetical protein [candidate division WOR-3 bacterium]